MLPTLPDIPHCALLVATLNRTTELARLLASLQKQTYTNFHIYIADQNPQGYLDAVLLPYMDMPITVIQVASCGVSAARNALLPHAHGAQGAIVAFPDDDCWYAPDTLERVADFFATRTDVDALMGVWGAVPKYTSAPRTRPLTRNAAFRRCETYVQFYRREVVQAIGGFDTILGPGTGLPYGCGEDTDYLLRVLDAGYSVWREPRVQVFHPLPEKGDRRLATKWRAYGMGRMYVLRKHTFPLWFQLAMCVYPLFMALKEGPRCWHYRWSMFCGRFAGLCMRSQTRTQKIRQDT